MISRRLFLVGLLAAAGLGVQGAAEASDRPLPPNMIFFAAGTSCPAGSTPASDAAGRLLLAITSVADVGKTHGKPLLIQEDRTHTHAGTMQVDLPVHSISAASGGGNGQATGNGAHSSTLTSGPATTGLPFIQLLVCQAE